jgi:hypothetical protein
VRRRLAYDLLERLDRAELHVHAVSLTTAGRESKKAATSARNVDRCAKECSKRADLFICIGNVVDATLGSFRKDLIDVDPDLGITTLKYEALHEAALEAERELSFSFPHASLEEIAAKHAWFARESAHEHALPLPEPSPAPADHMPQPNEHQRVPQPLRYEERVLDLRANAIANPAPRAEAFERDTALGRWLAGRTTVTWRGWLDPAGVGGPETANRTWTVSLSFPSPVDLVADATIELRYEEVPPGVVEVRLFDQVTVPLRDRGRSLGSVEKVHLRELVRAFDSYRKPSIEIVCCDGSVLRSWREGDEPLPRR